MKHVGLTMLLALVACTDGRPTAESEVAGELRALRAVLVQRAAEPASEAKPFDPAGLAAALSPLRDVLDGLAKQQAELQQRQLSLTQEMQRWSQLLVDSVGAARRDEGTALTQRLQQLEAALQEQKTRTQQTEALLQNALDRTADRLEEFLKRVGAEGETKTPAPPPPAAPVSTPPKSVGDVVLPRRAQQTALWWWSGAVVVSALCGFVCFRRWQKRPLRRIAAPPPSSAAASTPMVRPDDGVQEIWAAAALLGEAVGRLRESSQPTSPADSVAPAPTLASDAVDAAAAAEVADAAATHDPELADFIVLDDELLRPGEAVVPSAEPASAPPPKPPALVCHVPTADPGRAMDAALQFLGADPRVLRRPEPTVRRGRDGLEIAFRAVPGLPPGEQSHLEQSLRDVCR